MLGTRCISRDKRQVNVGRCGTRQFALGFFRRFFQALQGHGVLAQIHAIFLQKFLGQKVNHALIKVVAAQMGIAIGRFDFKDAIAQFENRNVKRTTTEVVNRDFFIILFVHTISQ